nr:DUF1796 family putative cysteine peptidase [Paenibacillus monticola]
MNLQDVKKNYDLIVSLGASCAPAVNMKRWNLRKFSMPLDWMVSISLTDVNRLLQNKFQNFMEFDNLSVQEDTHYFLDEGLPIFVDRTETAVVKSYFIKDTLYNITSVHDFPIIEGTNWTMTYPSYKAKLDLRIKRFWDRLTNSKNTLFIRWSADYEQAVELQSILSHLLNKNNFTVIILNPVHELISVREANWNIKNVCALEFPNNMDDYESWDYILKDIVVTND